MTYTAQINGKYTRQMAAYIMKDAEEREIREFAQVRDQLKRDGISCRSTQSLVPEDRIDLNETDAETYAIEWTSEYGYPVRIFWHWAGFEIRTARYIGRNCYSLFPGYTQVIGEVARQNQQVSDLIHHMSQEFIMKSADVNMETAQRWMIEAEERDPMPEYDHDGTRGKRTHNRFGERVQ